MSFGILLSNKDISFDGAGSVYIVTGETKLQQGLTKILMTEQGRNYFHQLYGSTLYNLLGSKLTNALLSSLLSKNVARTLQYFQQIQQNQRLVQYVDPNETMASIEQIIINQLSSTEISFKIVLRTMAGSQTVALTNIQQS